MRKPAVEEVDNEDNSRELIIDSYSNAAAPFSLTFQTKSGLIYIIEASQDMIKWVEVAEQKGNGSTVEFIEPRKALFPMQYYRIKITD